MKNPIKTLEIKNFKTIKDSKKIDCKRINIFIGKPNVGKSNILEAISLLGAKYSQNYEKYLSDFIRYENFENLFYDNETDKKIEVITNIGIANIIYDFPKDTYDLTINANTELLKENYEENKEAMSSGKMKQLEMISSFFVSINATDNHYGQFAGSDNYLSPVRKFDFIKKEDFKARFNKFLYPPYGDNLFSVVHHNKNLYKELTTLFKEYKLELVLKIKEAKFEIQKKIDGVIYSYPYSTIADTLQRFIFYLIAIETNKDSILLFEEPEAHSFPPYIRKIAQRIIDSKENQFFITTHSPFILNTIVENSSLKDVAVFVADYQKHQTTIKPLSEKEIKNMLDYGIDIFSNLK